MKRSRTRQDLSLQLWFAGCLLLMFALSHLSGLAVLFLYSFRLALLPEKIISIVLFNSMAETAAAFLLVNRYLFQCSTDGADQRLEAQSPPGKDDETL